MALAGKFMQKCNIPLTQGNCKKLDHNLNLWLFMYDTEAMLAAERQKTEKLRKSTNYLRLSPNALPMLQTKSENNETIHHHSVQEKLVDHLGRSLAYLTTKKYKRISPEMLEMINAAKKPKTLHEKWFIPVRVGAVNNDNVAQEFLKRSKLYSPGRNIDGGIDDGTDDGVVNDTVASANLPSSLAKHLHDSMKSTSHQNELYGINFYQKKQTIPKIETTTDKNLTSEADYLDPNALGPILNKLKTSQTISDKELDHLIKFIITALHADSEMVGQLLELLRARGLLSNDIIGYLRKLLQHSINDEAFTDMIERLGDVLKVFEKSDQIDIDDPYSDFGSSAKFFPAKVKKVKKSTSQHERKAVVEDVQPISTSAPNVTGSHNIEPISGKIYNKNKRGRERKQSQSQSSAYKIGSRSNLKQNDNLKSGPDNQYSSGDFKNAPSQEYQFGESKVHKTSADLEGHGDQKNVVSSRRRSSYYRQKMARHLGERPSVNEPNRNSKTVTNRAEETVLRKKGKPEKLWYAEETVLRKKDKPEKLWYAEETVLRKKDKPEKLWYAENQLLDYIKQKATPLAKVRSEGTQDMPIAMKFKRERTRVPHAGAPIRLSHDIRTIEKKPMSSEFYGYLVHGGFFKPWSTELNFADKQKFYRMSTAQRDSYPSGLESLPTKTLKSEGSVITYPKLDTYLRNKNSKTIPGNYYTKSRLNMIPLTRVKSQKLVRLPTFMYRK